MSKTAGLQVVCRLEPLSHDSHPVVTLPINDQTLKIGDDTFQGTPNPPSKKRQDSPKNSNQAKRRPLSPSFFFSLWLCALFPLCCLFACFACLNAVEFGLRACIFPACCLTHTHAHVCTNAHACSEPRIWRRNVKQGCCGPFEQNSGGCAAGWLQLKRHLVWKRLGNNSLWLDNKPRQCLLRH